MQMLAILLLILCAISGLVKSEVLEHSEFIRRFSSNGHITNTGNIVKVGCRPGTVKVRGRCRPTFNN